MKKKIPIPDITCPVERSRIHCKMLSIMPETEHLMFVVYAGVEVVHLPATFWWVNVFLLVSGSGAFVYRKVVKNASVE